jgi:hypothetical protein
VVEFIRIILLLALAGAAVTFLGSAIAWWMEDQRRLRRLVRKVLGGPPDGVIVAPRHDAVGRGAAAGFRLASDQVVVMREGGANALLYRLHALLGAELIVDDQVVARTMRDEPRRVLDQVNNDAKHVVLRLLFDDARNPDFSLELWVPRDSLRRNARPPAAAIREARGWLIRAEAIMRRAGPPPVTAPPPEPVVETWPEHDDIETVIEEEDEGDNDATGAAQELPWDDPDDEPRLL